jgi:hypothetical protein
MSLDGTVAALRPAVDCRGLGYRFGEVAALTT